jgi:hypothetical protein
MKGGKMNGKVKFPFIKPKKVYRNFSKKTIAEVKKVDIEIKGQEKKLQNLKYKRENIILNDIMGHIND